MIAYVFNQMTPALDALKMTVLLALVEYANEFLLDESSETFVQPEMLPVFVGHQVSSPRKNQS